LSKLPVMTASAGRLLARLSRRDCDLAEVAALIEQDPVLSAQVVQSANSAAFSRAQQVDSVLHAIVMVGVGTIRKFALVQTVSNLFSRRPPAALFSMTRFNLHSVAVAVMMELLADEVTLEDREGAFLSGLFHDIGTLLIAVAMPRQYETVQSVAAVSGRPLVECEEKILGTDHAELSGLALERWGLAEHLQRAAAHHHAPEASPVPQVAAKNCVRLSLALHQADALIDMLGMSIDPPRAMDQPLPSIEFAGHALNQERLLERFATEWKAVDAMLR
jgi:two-component system, cell cycle response regulator